MSTEPQELSELAPSRVIRIKTPTVSQTMKIRQARRRRARLLCFALFIIALSLGAHIALNTGFRELFLSKYRIAIIPVSQKTDKRALVTIDQSSVSESVTTVQPKPPVLRDPIRQAEPRLHPPPSNEQKPIEAPRPSLLVARNNTQTVHARVVSQQDLPPVEAPIPRQRVLLNGTLAQGKAWELAWTHEYQQSRISALAFSSDNSLLAVVRGSTLVLLDTSTGKEANTIRGLGYVPSISFSPDGRLLAVAKAEQKITILEVESGAVSETLNTIGFPAEVVFHPQGETLIIRFDSNRTAADQVHVLQQYSVAKKVFLSNVTGHQGRLISMTLSDDGTTLATTGDSICVWREDSPMRLLYGHSSRSKEIHTISISADGKYLLSRTPRTKKGAQGEEEARSFRIWDTRSGRFADITAHRDSISAVRFGPKNIFATASFDGQIMLWNMDSMRNRDPKPLHTLEGHTHFVSGLVFDSTETTLVSSGRDARVIFWKVASGEKMLVEEFENSEAIYHLRCSPNSQLIVTGHSNSTVRAWKRSATEIARTP